MQCRNKTEFHIPKKVNEEGIIIKVRRAVGNWHLASAPDQITTVIGGRIQNLLGKWLGLINK